jgi:NitT/TauT family transport system permease protein
MTSTPWLAPRLALSQQRERALTLFSFMLPLLIWAAVSYTPFIWHPNMEITEPGSVNYFQEGMQIERATFQEEYNTQLEAGGELPQGFRANPVYLPAPHEVAIAFYTSFTTEPRRRSEQWLHESLWHSIQIIFWGFTLSSILGVPLGILSGTFAAVSRLHEPSSNFSVICLRQLLVPWLSQYLVFMTGPRLRSYLLARFFNRCWLFLIRHANWI